MNFLLVAKTQLDGAITNFLTLKKTLENPLLPFAR